ncbi:hypothetical protein LSUB1_G007470 [Lachnellula subtilissima]|uniref:TLC domain-containing protein n=1 Tax=Lachnellula subtilissima TaxID=602034 RepID=A0A8H8RE40_9HELO|nr:hypothetical protein LSUB1_G007470 [Lachnellula subtilissima]
MGLPAASALHADAHNETLSGKGPHIKHVPLESISKLAPYSALILCIIFVIYFLFRFYILERFLLRKVYGKTYTQMDETTRRGFVNHHIAGGTKVAILILAAYPFICVVFMTGTLHSRFAGSKHVTMGDILIIAAQALVAMYVFELFYRPKISPVSVGHHIGAIMIGQSAIAISLNLSKEKDATIEFLLCLVWGAFDIISEFLPHITIILYRVYPTDHRFLRKLFRMSAITTLIGTITETVLVFFLWGSLWNWWTLAFKVTTPILHVIFAAAQLWGTDVLYTMYKKQCSIIAKKDDVETTAQTEGKDVVVNEVESTTRTEEHKAEQGETPVVSEYSASCDRFESSDNRARRSSAVLK